MVLQQTPRCVTAEPPSEVTVPPHVPLFIEILLALDVVSVGRAALILVVVRLI